MVPARPKAAEYRSKLSSIYVIIALITLPGACLPKCRGIGPIAARPVISRLFFRINLVRMELSPTRGKDLLAEAISRKVNPPMGMVPLGWGQMTHVGRLESAEGKTISRRFRWYFDSGFAGLGLECGEDYCAARLGGYKIYLGKLKHLELKLLCGSSSAGRAPASQAGCRGFDSRLPLFSFLGLGGRPSSKILGTRRG